jgi:hypothetical protein
MPRSRSRPTLIAVLFTLLTIGWSGAVGGRGLSLVARGAPGWWTERVAVSGAHAWHRGTRDDDPDAPRPYPRRGCIALEGT